MNSVLGPTPPKRGTRETLRAHAAPYRNSNVKTPWERILLCWCLLACSAPAFGLDPAKTLSQYTHRVWGQEEGLFQPTVYSILQTRDGFLWLGTQDSLIRFDGVHFREFEANGAAVLHGALIRSLLEDSNGNLWAGTIGSGIFRISPTADVVQYTTRDGLPSDNVFCLDKGRDGSLWACTEGGLVRFRDAAHPAFSIIGNLPSNGARETCEAADGTRWVAGLQFGLVPLARPPIPELRGITSVTALQCAAGGAVWAGTGTGLIRFTRQGIKTFTTRDGLPDNAIDSLAESSDGSIWIGADGGISRWRNDEMNVYRTRDGLSHSVVLSLYFDREGTLWAGTKDGLDQFTNPKLTPYTTAEGLSSNEAGPVVEGAPGRLWIGTLDAGLNLFDGRRFQRITVADGLASNRILSLAAESSGDLWAGTSAGLNRLQNGRVTGTYAQGEEIRALFLDSAGILWVGTGHGLLRLQGNVLQRASKDDKAVFALSRGDSSRIFVSTEDNPLDYGPIRPVDCYLFNRASNSVWMGMLGSGLLRLHDGKVAKIHVKDGLWDNRIYAILPDRHGNFWFASSKGIFRIAAQQLEDFADGKIHTVTSIPFTTGQLRFECRAGVQPAACRTRDGRLWFATTSGVVVVDPEHLADNPLPPPVAVTSIFVDGARRKPNPGLQLKAFEKNVEIRYAGLSFVSPEKISFRYILEGYDKNWTEAGTRREAFFTNLPPRTFHFRVVARNADGVWSRQPAVMEFSVQPRFYQRPWFFPSLAALAALFIFLGYRRRVRSIQHSFDIVLAERSRIARELHDTLLQGLSGVTMQLQALRMRMPPSREKHVLGEIIHDAGECSIEARQSLWGLRSPEAEAASLADKLTTVCHEVLLHTPLHLDLDIESVNLEGCPEMEYQLLRIAREALLNTVKHARASTVRVGLKRHHGILEMRVTDDGEGFDCMTDYGAAGHFGLRGMRERAAEIGAELVCESTRSGTAVFVRVAVGETAAAAAAVQQQVH
jgi:signal transduction histidine kinase/ligand-binding sensor domain-containing protein